MTRDCGHVQEMTRDCGHSAGDDKRDWDNSTGWMTRDCRQYRIDTCRLLETVQGMTRDCRQ
ncbi:unnamed protein product [Staurois parvus]|uniref:Uncharacterized protein n=1 Tax=Staurois parvus TaxID=386267 RepID=A0ABN9GXM3_9NEOB|nr:unnamed protein product [Staurois parvus]